MQRVHGLSINEVVQWCQTCRSMKRCRDAPSVTYDDAGAGGRESEYVFQISEDARLWIFAIGERTGKLMRFDCPASALTAPRRP